MDFEKGIGTNFIDILKDMYNKTVTSVKIIN